MEIFELALTIILMILVLFVIFRKEWRDRRRRRTRALIEGWIEKSSTESLNYPDEEFLQNDDEDFLIRVHNNDITTIEFVVVSLVSIFKYDINEAIVLMADIQKNGYADLGRYSHENAIHKAELLKKKSVDHKMELTVEVVDGTSVTQENDNKEVDPKGST